MNRRERRAAARAADFEAARVEARAEDKARTKAKREREARRQAYEADPARFNLAARLAGCADAGLAAAFVLTMPARTFKA